LLHGRAELPRRSPERLRRRSSLLGYLSLRGELLILRRERGSLSRRSVSLWFSGFVLRRCQYLLPCRWWGELRGHAWRPRLLRQVRSYLRLGSSKRGANLRRGDLRLSLRAQLGQVFTGCARLRDRPYGHRALWLLCQSMPGSRRGICALPGRSLRARVLSGIAVVSSRNLLPAG